VFYLKIKTVQHIVHFTTAILSDFDRRSVQWSLQGDRKRGVTRIAFPTDLYEIDTYHKRFVANTSVNFCVINCAQ